MKAKDQPELTVDEKDRLFSFFELLMLIDIKQNPENYTNEGKITHIH